MTPTGYVKLFKKGHPNANPLGYVFEHRFVISEKIGRPLLRSEVVHHINGVRSDNRIENLVLCAASNSGKTNDRPVHAEFHRNGRAILSDSDVIALRKERQEMGTIFRELAAKYGITKSTAIRACARFSWKNV